MLEIIVKVLAVGGPAALAVMGFVVIDRPPKSDRGRIIWYAAFSVIAFFSVAAAIVDSEEQEKRITAMILGGGDDFPLIYGMNRSDGKLELMIANEKGMSPLYDVSFSIAKAGTFTAIAAKNWGTIQNFAYDTGIALDPGSYQIDFSARNGMFIEMLFFGTCDGKITQVRSIYKPLEGGRVMQEQPNYKHCVGIPEQPILDDPLEGIAVPF
jgi:hypothetical protein